jgi:hypothetical protein
VTAHYRLRPQAAIEARLLDHTNPERVSWHVGQIAALLFTLGAEEWVSVDVAYRLWVGRNDNSSQEEG